MDLICERFCDDYSLHEICTVMNFLCLVPFFLAQTQVVPPQTDSLSWSISENWSPATELNTTSSWNLDAPSPGTYRLWGCSTSPFPELTLDMRWRQDLSGSNNNQSRFFITESPPDLTTYSDYESLPEGSLIISVGRNGSDDPLEITTPFSSSFQEINSEYFDFSSPFDLDLSLRIDSSYSTSTLRASIHDSNISLPLSDNLIFTPPDNWQPKCIGFEAKCTSSNTDAFSWALLNLQNIWTPLPSPKIISHAALDSISVEIAWNRLPPNGISGPINAVSVPPPTSSPHLSIFSHLDQMQDGISSPLRISVGEMDTVLSMVWTDNEKVAFRELTITELFVDATPSLGLPEVEWMEVLNTTDRIININDWGLIAESVNSTTEINRPLLPSDGWNGLIAPHERFLICTSPYTESNSIFDHGYYAQASGFSSLSDNGMTLTLLRPDGTLIDQITYERSWWHDESLAARSTNKVHPLGCGLAENWRPSYSSIGASPWESSALENSQQISISPLVISPHFRNSHRVEFTFSPSLDPISTIHALVSQENNAIELRFENPYWVMDRLTPLTVGKPLQIIIEGGQLCSNGYNINGVLDGWIPSRSPRWNDLVISEFLTNPSPDSPWDEWVEIANISGETLDLEGLSLNSGTFIPEITLRADSFLVLSPDNFISWSPLSANAGIITLTVNSNKIDVVNYTKCFHDNGDKADGGFSLERRNLNTQSNDPDNWASGVGSMGGSPGKEREISSTPESEVAIQDTTVIWGEFEGKIAWNSTFAMDSSVLNMLNWSPQIEWSFLKNDLQIAISSIDINTLFDQFGDENDELKLECFSWKTISDTSSSFLNQNLNSWRIERPTESSSLSFRLNEFLGEPALGEGKFIEIGNIRDEISSTDGLIISTDAEPQPNDWTEFTDVNWWVPKNGFLAVAECPNWILNSNEKSIIVKGDIPSLTNGRTLQLTSYMFNEIDSIRITEYEKGVSKARLDLYRSLWINTPLIVGGSSPGRINYSSLIPLNLEHSALKNSPLTISPKTINLNSISNHRWAQIEWTPPEDTGVWSIGIKVLTQNGNCIATLTESEEIETCGVWIFEGLDNEGRSIYPGTYIVVLEGENIKSEEVIGRKTKVILRGLIHVTAM
ncbi:MAG TPA: lamin tail domain-containing protein [Flavobacteriales bacterium]|nr:lamin tail domain-containing protein [Flavobacteriales bacterium]